MTCRAVMGGFLLLGCVRLVGAAEAPEKLAEERARLHASSPAEFAVVVDNPALPRVLLIGDSISIGYTLPVRERLRGVANVHRAFENCGPTTRGLQQLDEWLGSAHWDVIHFNFGLHDITRLDGKEPRTPLAEYEKNLRVLTARLHATGAKLVFATMTPVPVVTQGPMRLTADAIAYNATARRLMAKLSVPIDDLETFAAIHLKSAQLPGNVHFTDEGYAAMGEAVATAIRAALPRP